MLEADPVQKLRRNDVLVCKFSGECFISRGKIVIPIGDEAIRLRLKIRLRELERRQATLLISTTFRIIGSLTGLAVCVRPDLEEQYPDAVVREFR